MSNQYSAADHTRESGAPPTNPDGDKGRSPFKKDYARLIHAPAFRRLQGKTQLFPGKESDFFRNRLTHSLEVAQIASGIAERINALLAETGKENSQLDLDLVEFAGLAHDLGHPPFGHNGEKALDEKMLSYGGFEGNAQTLHILAKVERKGIPGKDGKLLTEWGLDLCHRTLASVLKYDRDIPFHRRAGSKLVKGYYSSEKNLVVRIKESVAPRYTGKFKTVECQIMDLADDIAYSTYDLEDSLHAQFVTPFSLMGALATDQCIQKKVLEKTNDSLKEANYHRITEKELLEQAADIFGKAAFVGTSSHHDHIENQNLKNAMKGVEHLAANKAMSANSVIRSRFTAQRIGNLIEAVELITEIEDQLLPPSLWQVRLTREALLQVEILKHLNFELVISSPRLAVVEYRGKQLVHDIFQALRNSDGSLLPEDWKERYVEGKQASDSSHERVLCDFIAGMTDDYAVEFHAAIAGDGGSIFKPL